MAKPEKKAVFWPSFWRKNVKLLIIHNFFETRVFHTRLQKFYIFVKSQN